MGLALALVGVAAVAVGLAIAEGGDDSGRRAGAAGEGRKSRPAPRPRTPPPPAPRRRPPAGPRDDRGYPEGTKRRFASVCEERTPLDADACECVYDRLHDDYSYEEFRRLIRKIDPERRSVPPELLEHVLRCRLP